MPGTNVTAPRADSRTRHTRSACSPSTRLACGGVGQPSTSLDEVLSLLSRLVFAVRAELYQQESAAVWKQFNVFEGHLLTAQEVHQQAVESFEPDRFVLQNLRDGIRRDECIGKAEYHELSMLWALHQPHSGFEHRDTGRLGADHRARNVETILRQQLIQVVTGDSARDIGEALTNERLHSCRESV